jgi:neutral ceramidase
LASARIIGRRLAKGAHAIYKNNTKQKLKVSVDCRAATVNMTALLVSAAQNPAKLSSLTNLCLPALGYGFGAGTIDGPGLSAFHQGDTLQKHTLWDMLRNLIRKPSSKQAHCQFPKPILIAGGELHVPYSWLPEILHFQVLRLGHSHYLLTCPAEITTMAGRRIRSAIQSKIKSILEPSFGQTEEDPAEEVTVLLLTVCNGYASYLTTPEEYGAQRYEGASTLYGPHSLAAFIYIFEELVTALLKKSEVSNLPIVPIPDESPNFIEFARLVRPDHKPFFGFYGQILQDTNQRYYVGDTVKVIFQGVHPSNNFAQISSFIAIERQVEDSGDTWELIFDDFDDCTLFEWRYNSFIWRTSEVTISWTIPKDCPVGMFRIRYSGFKRNSDATFEVINGTSSLFQVSSSNADQL